MYSVVNIAGQQFKVFENNSYYVPKLSDEPESEITFNDILLLGDEKKIKVGSPSVKGAKVQAKVLEHLKDEKVIVFKKKRRKGYRKTQGHRQQYSRIQITGIEG